MTVSPTARRCAVAGRRRCARLFEHSKLSKLTRELLSHKPANTSCLLVGERLSGPGSLLTAPRPESLSPKDLTASSQVSASDGLLATAIGVAAHRSIEEGRPIALAELLSQEVLSTVRADRERARGRASQQARGEGGSAAPSGRGVAPKL